MKSEVRLESAELAQLAAFKVGRHECAIDIMRVKEIVNPIPITPLPKSPDFLEGVIELRGAIIPMVDMRKRFDMEVSGARKSTKYIIVSCDGRILGLVVDSVTDVLRIPLDKIHRPPAILGQQSAQPFIGMFRYQDRFILIVDLNVLLTSKEKFRLAEMEEEPQPSEDS